MVLYILWKVVSLTIVLKYFVKSDDIEGDWVYRNVRTCIDYWDHCIYLNVNLALAKFTKQFMGETLCPSVDWDVVRNVSLPENTIRSVGDLFKSVLQICIAKFCYSVFFINRKIIFHFNICRHLMKYRNWRKVADRVFILSTSSKLPIDMIRTAISGRKGTVENIVYF